MSTRPSVSPEALADIVAGVPPRVSKRLDANPRAADEWAWSFADVVTIVAGEETVTLPTAGVLAAKDATCTCLLAPRCFHLAAVLTVLPLADGAKDEGGTKVPEARTSAMVLASSGATEAPATTDEERALALDAARIGAEILADGLSRVSTLRMGRLLRVVHACRRAGLPRLESAALGVYEHARDLRAKSTAFRLKEAAARLAELLLVAHRLHVGDPDRTWRGIARRTYRPSTGLRVAGLACEPVLQRGYAGVVTHFTDGTRVYSAQEVLPGDSERARHAYDAQLRFGETSLSHAEASRGGLLFARAEISDDGRLGAGREVACVSTSRDASLVERLFDEPFESQIAGNGAAGREGLVFVRGTIGGGDADGAFVATVTHTVPLVVPIDDLVFAYRENLERLAHATAKVRLVARLDPSGAALSPIAVTITTGEGERSFSLAYDRIAKNDLASIVADPDPTVLPAVPATKVGADVLDPVRRRLLRYALAGAASLPSAALPEVAREAKLLREALFATAATGLEALALGQGEARAAEVWLALHVYTTAAERVLARAAWGTGPV